MPSLAHISGITTLMSLPSVSPTILNVSVYIVPPAVLPLEELDAKASFALPSSGTANAHINELLKIFVLTSSKYGLSASSHTSWISKTAGSYITKI